MTKSLKPCPFCESAAVLKDISPDDELLYYAGCDYNDCKIECYYISRDEAEAIAAWNRRVPADDAKTS